MLRALWLMVMLVLFGMVYLTAIYFMEPTNGFYMAHDLEQKAISRCSQPYPSKYLVTLALNSELSEHLEDLWQAIGTNHSLVALLRTWNIGRFNGYSIEFPDKNHCVRFWTAYDAGYFGEAVAHVEMDTTQKVDIQQMQVNPPWGLDRIDQRAYPLDGRYQSYPDSGGEGVDIYIVDTGINIKHKDFEGRAVWGTTTRSDNAPDFDDNGHGSHVAGIAGSKTYGVAKKARLIAVKALDADGHGPYSELIEGLQWVARNAPPTGNKSIVNSLSIQGEVSQALNGAVTGLLDLGIHVVSASGNRGQDACGFSPAEITTNTSAISVGAVDDSDTEPAFSNYGDCVSIMGPGVRILSVDADSNDGTRVMSGTSMAAPHVSGVLAILLAGATDGNGIPTDPAGLKTYVLSHVTKDVTASDGTAKVNSGVVYIGPT
ncbi:uncharacterized protein SPPG_01423 [Spizellomyces punctatus DAOM BR117]|uniref:Peptidase S8/S53 domain-containing protein n=1 Tax=Spizellomyces punctatus (strain DAOM BR117) TaxID=645134 RepID=A0A0L0HS73_SPIPD|nr:uncharacterized protein SPPG_01423 [Spizellomyces punctatus DAOM BR117]KND03973.1 hypothetical protein SPPG_01423 [Spizellomyces punctatus DAOM BR117]|eukprot:XP_016612012.1 hypothetical protein SPPG_01423 [Spizellomyces punctatus DAOM BR117]